MVKRECANCSSDSGSTTSKIGRLGCRARTCHPPFGPHPYPPHACTDMSALALLTLALAAVIAAAVWLRPTFNKRTSAGRAPRSVALVVLGDIGRSPRMIYHAQSFVAAGFKTSIVAYAGELHAVSPARPTVLRAPMTARPPHGALSSPSQADELVASQARPLLRPSPTPPSSPSSTCPHPSPGSPPSPGPPSCSSRRSRCSWARQACCMRCCTGSRTRPDSSSSRSGLREAQIRALWTVAGS